MPFYGKNEQFFELFKNEFFNKDLAQLKQKEICKDIFEEKNIFEYLNSIKQTNELIFIKFEPKESLTHKSKLFLLGEPASHETSTVYELAFKELLNQAHNKSGHVKLDTPKELEKDVESFYLFTLNKKDKNVSDKSFLEKFSISLVRDRDFIMGVVIRKPKVNGSIISKEKVREEMNSSSKKQSIIDFSKENVSPSQSTKVQNTVSSIRDPRILKKIEREEQKKALEGQKNPNSISPIALKSLKTNIEFNQIKTKITDQKLILNNKANENDQKLGIQSKPKKRVSFDHYESSNSEDKENDPNLNSKKIKL